MKRIVLLLGIFLFGAVLFACTPKVVPVEKSKTQKVTGEQLQVIGKEPWEMQWEKTLSDARKEGIVVVYGGSGPEGREVIIKGMKRLGLEAEVMPLKSADLVGRVASERKAGLYLADIYTGGTATPMTALKPAGYLERIDGLPFLPDVIESSLWYGGKGLRYADSDRTLILFSSYVPAIVSININLVKKGKINSYYDLLNPEWKGKLLMHDPTIGGQGLQAFGAVGSRILNWDYWKEFVRQEPVIMRDQRVMGDWLSKGKYPIAVGLAGQYDIFREAGAPIYQANFKGESFISAGAGSMSLFKQAPHPNAARVLVNWLLSREGQTLWSREKNSGSTRLDVSQEHLDEDKRIDPAQKYFEAEDEAFLLERPKHIKKAEEIFGHLLK